MNCFLIPMSTSTEDTTGIRRILHIDDENPMISRSIRRTLFFQSREVEPGVFRGKFENRESGMEVEFRVAYGLVTFLQILERLTETKAQVDLVMLDGELGCSGSNPVSCHGLDIVQIATALFGECDFPEYLGSKKVPGEEDKGTLEERFRRIPREVYATIKFMIISGAYQKGTWISSRGERVDYMPRFRELDAQAPGLIQGLYPKPCDNHYIRSEVQRILGIQPE